MEISEKDLKAGLAKVGINVLEVIDKARQLGVSYAQLISLIENGGGNMSGGEKEPMHIYDRLTIKKLNANGEVVEERDSGWSKNGITNAGFAEVAGLLLADVGGSAFDYVAIGTGTTAFSASDTALETEIKRKAGTGSRVTTTVTNDTAQLQATFSSSDGLTGSSAVTESGVLNASSDGTLLCRQTFSALNLNWDSGDSLQVTWKIQIKQGS